MQTEISVLSVKLCSDERLSVKHYYKTDNHLQRAFNLFHLGLVA